MAEPASACISQPDIAVIRLDFHLTQFADGGNILPSFSRLFNGNVLKVLESLFGRLFLSDDILTIQAEPPAVDPFDISFFAATVTARNFRVPHLCPLL